MASSIIRPTFSVIHGGHQTPPPWQDLPKTILARSPFSRDEIGYFRVARGDAQKALAANRRQPFLDFWSCVYGRLPPVNNISSQDPARFGAALISIADAHACFRGLKRPFGDDAHGWDRIVYISRPKWFYVYEPSLACVLKLLPVPNDLLFAIYARLDHPASGRMGSRAVTGAAAKGIITHWEFVECDPHSEILPVDHSSRYRRRLW